MDVYKKHLGLPLDGSRPQGKCQRRTRSCRFNLQVTVHISGMLVNLPWRGICLALRLPHSFVIQAFMQIISTPEFDHAFIVIRLKAFSFPLS